ncbi:MAG: hypothetical protein HXX10_21430 [Rhodoplanes sp.]|uniref:hypothetical protein n=1 Tax=Rhodoplanes sp. TaxID=1968906 RepID=UPI0017FC82EC|nr:hypothetical protein [Rhodoplanes sp.]NVO16597.1 hypothetical protein [Rhodoplanes sp.]
MHVFIWILSTVLLFLTYDVVALGSRYQSGLLSSASQYGAVARYESRGVIRRHGL